MEKEGNLVLIVAVIIVITTTLIITWQALRIINKDKIDNETISELENSNITSDNISNLTKETEIIDTENITNPTGSIIPISREDSTGKYFCNKTQNPAHAIRVYTYKIINGTKNLSEKYIESSKIKVCDEYNNKSVTRGVRYTIEWNWDPVDKVDGYKIYQYFYLNKNISREYDYGVDVKTNRFFDTSLDLWRKN